jgi:hypothetical protein
MSTTLVIIGTIFGLISGALTSYGHDVPALMTLLLAITAFSLALLAHLKDRQSDSNSEERKLLLNSALEVIDARTRLTIELVSDFRDNINKYRYALTEEQREFISHLLSTVGDVRINDTEIGSDTLSKEERKKLISENREHLDKIEKSRIIIEQYLSNYT